MPARQTGDLLSERLRAARVDAMIARCAAADDERFPAVR
jgi:hypothetical protein